MSPFLKYSMAGALTALLLCFCSAPLFGQDEAKDSLSSTVLKAYSLLSTSPKEAIPLFKWILSKDPGNVQIQRQLGYLFESVGEHEAALEEFTKAEALESSDTTKLQIAYILLGLNRVDAAKKICNELESTASDDIRNKATRLLGTIASPVSTFSPWWTHFYEAPYYDTRWNSWFIDGFVQRGYYLSGEKIVSGYGIISVSGDLKSRGGTRPEIFSDNTLMAGFGIRVNPFQGLLLDIQWALAFDLIDRNTGSGVHGDFRTVAIYANGVYPAFDLHDDLRMPFHPLAEIYASAGNYSRFETNIGYVQLKGGARFLEMGHATMDFYARINAVRDAHTLVKVDLGYLSSSTAEKKFYNNLLEGGIGTMLTPHNEFGLHFAAEYFRGAYWGISDSEIPKDFARWYNDVRLFVIFEQKIP